MDLISTAVGAVAVIAILVGPLVALAYAAINVGVDSRPAINDRDTRPWLWRGRFD
jgi:hypothetical protein